MKVYQKKQSNPIVTTSIPQPKKSFWLYGIFWLFFILFSGVIVFSLRVPVYMWALNHGFELHTNKTVSFAHRWTSVGKALLKAPGVWSNAFANQLPQLTIDIKFKHYEKLSLKREKALKTGILIKESDDLVPAVIRIGDKKIPVKMRLKGDNLDHLETDKWSFRIIIKGKNQIFGMRRFSVQNPITRFFHGQPIFFRICRELGILTPRFIFVNLKINGNDKGIMALEEHFSKEMLEYNERRESVIIRFDESDKWDLFKFDFSLYNFYNSKIDPFQNKKVFKNADLSKQYKMAVGLLRAVIWGKIQPSEAFDKELLGNFFAATDLWGWDHGVHFGNMRFYYNPINARLEPIAFDSSAGGIRKTPYRPTFSWSPSKEFLNDPNIYQAYIEGLETLVYKLKNEGLLTRLKDIENEYFKILGKEFFLMQRKKLENLIWRGECLLGKNKCGNFDLYPSLLKAYVLENEKGPYLEINNMVPYDLEIKVIEWFNPEKELAVPIEGTAKNFYPAKLKATQFRKLPVIYKVRLLNDLREKGYQIRLWVNIKGNDSYGPIFAEPQSYSSPLKNHPLNVYTIKKLMKRHPFLILNSTDHALSIKPGTWKVKHPLIIPKKYSLKIPAGTILNFIENGSLISFGPIHLQGTEQSPIILDGTDTTWKGIAVIESPQPSNWSHVIIRKTKGVHLGEWSLKGGVNFYKSDINISNSKLTSNESEDALNIIHSKFLLDNILIENTVSDGFDSDFSEGTVKNSYFRNIGSAGGGDAIDVSGSQIIVENTQFKEISDKGLSVGERSKMIAKNLKMTEIGVGAATKDGSFLEIKDSIINKPKLAGLMAYIKKEEYGPAQIEASNIEIIGTANTAKSQTGNSISLDGKPIPNEDINITSLYETIMKPGLRK